MNPKNVKAKHKVYALILGVGFSALIADRLSGGGDPSPAIATLSPARLESTATVNTSTNIAGGSSMRSDSGSISELLRQAPRSPGLSSAGLSAPMHDPFAPGAAWGVSAAAAESGNDPAARFVQSHHLTNVIISGNTRRAMVDGRILKVGQPLDGFTLIAITPRAATFESGSSRASLSMGDNHGVSVSGGGN